MQKNKSISGQWLFTIALLFLVVCISPYAGAQDTTGEDEFKAWSEEGTQNQTNEFSEWNEDEAQDEFSDWDEGDDEFSDWSEGDEFSEFSEYTEEDSSTTCKHSCNNSCGAKGEIDLGFAKIKTDKFNWTLSIMLATILAGILVRFGAGRKLRGIFLISSILILGFWKVGCTGCPITTLMDFVLYTAGYADYIGFGLLFIGLILITYFLGQVWCGWICPFGALQELLYLPGKAKWLVSHKTKKAFLISRIVLLIALLIQLGVMGTKYWCNIDPFTNIFAFRAFFDFVLTATSFHTEMIIVIILILLLLVTSVLSYRPFCRTMCPVGFILGQVARIPGAALVGIDGKCASCKMCNNACTYNAIIRADKVSVLDNTDCIACGDCMDACPKDGLTFMKNSRKVKAKVICKHGECEFK